MLRKATLTLLCDTRTLCGLGIVFFALSQSAFSSDTNFPAFSPATATDYISDVTKAFESQPDPAGEVCAIEARIRKGLGRSDEAEQWALKGLQIAPARADLYSLLADLYIRQSRVDEAKKALQKTLELDPKHPNVHDRLGMLQDQSGDRESARKTFEAGLELSPNNAGLHLLLGRLLLDAGQPKDAIVHLQRACQLDATLSNAFYVLAQAQTQSGDTEGAKSTRAAFDVLKNKERGDRRKMDAAFDNEKNLRAIAAEFHTEAGRYLLAQHHPELAEAHLLQAISIIPDDVASHESLSKLYLDAKRWPQAKRELETLVKLLPAKPSYHVNLGTLLLQTRANQAAAKELERALELDPKDPDALHNLALSHLIEKKDLTKAMELCQRLTEVQPTAVNFDLLAWSCFVNGKVTEARSAATKAVEMDPNNPTFREHFRRISPQ